jgi:predicted RNA-binding Zn-ribbon protein involved in translation (DUF1610 family)
MMEIIIGFIVWELSVKFACPQCGGSKKLVAYNQRKRFIFCFTAA